MKSRKVNVSEVCVLALIGAVTLIFFLDLGSYSFETRLVPGVFLIITAFLLAIRVAAIIRQVTARYDPGEAIETATVAAEVDVGNPAQSVDRDAQRRFTIRSTMVIGSVFVYVSLIYLFGLYESIPIFVFAFARIIGRLGWLHALLIAGGTWVAAYVMFTLLLRLPPLHGIVSLELLVWAT